MWPGTARIPHEVDVEVTEIMAIRFVRNKQSFEDVDLARDGGEGLPEARGATNE